QINELKTKAKHSKLLLAGSKTPCGRKTMNKELIKQEKSAVEYIEKQVKPLAEPKEFTVQGF
ncbi:16839_t:CDS:2, partial [Funneliformis geosporum]